MTRPTPTRREITAYPAMVSDWQIRTLTPCVFADVALTDDAADLAQLEELTPATFGWPGLLARADRILIAAWHTLTEAFLTEHHARPGELPETYQVLREALGDDVLAAADDARIAVLPHKIGQHAWSAMSVGVQLLHFRHGAGSRELQRLRDNAQTSLMDLQQDLAGWTLAHPADRPAVQLPRGRTVRPLPVHIPGPRIGA